MKDKASSVIVELRNTNLMKGDHILHEQKYNTGHGVSAIPNEICGEIWRQPGQPKVQQEPVVYLLLEGTLGWECGISGLPVPAASQPPQPAHRGRTKTDPGYAPQKSCSWHDRTVAPSEAARLYPPPRNSLPRHAQAGHVSTAGAKTPLQTKAL